MIVNKVRRFYIAGRERLKNFLYDLTSSYCIYILNPREEAFYLEERGYLQRRGERIMENADTPSEIKNYEIITEGDKRVVPLEDSEGYHASYARLRRKINKILDGLPVVIDPSLYAGFQRFHIDVYAKTEDEALEILEKNIDKVKEIYELFGEIPGEFKVWRVREINF